MAKRPRSCARQSGSPEHLHWCTRNESRIVGTALGTRSTSSAPAPARLKILYAPAFPLIARGAIGLFPKGQDVEAELTEATKYWNIGYELVPGGTGEGGSGGGR